MKNNVYEKFCQAVFFAVILQIAGCSENVREESTNLISEQTKHVATADKQGLTWFAPELHSSRYRTLFFGYDTLDYRLAAPENPGSNTVSLLFEASYGGDLRHYDFAKGTDGTSRAISQQQHQAERCQLFNNLISSCLYKDRFSVALSRADLEQASKTGLQLQLTSESQTYEQIDLPTNYIQGFLKALENTASKAVP